jgi:hypothetical protein
MYWVNTFSKEAIKYVKTAFLFESTFLIQISLQTPKKIIWQYFFRDVSYKVYVGIENLYNTYITIYWNVWFTSNSFLSEVFSFLTM